MSWNGTVRCGHCYKKGHNRRGCPHLKKFAEENPDSWEAQVRRRAKKRASNRKCGWCKQTGHNARTCPEKRAAKTKLKELEPHVSKQLGHILSHTGCGKGAIIKTLDYDDNPRFGTVLSASYESGNKWYSVDNEEVPTNEEPRLKVLWHTGRRETIWTPSLDKELVRKLFDRQAEDRIRYWGYSSNMLVSPSYAPIDVEVNLSTCVGQCVEPIDQWIAVIEKSVKKCEDYKKDSENT